MNDMGCISFSNGLENLKFEFKFKWKSENVNENVRTEEYPSMKLLHEALSVLINDRYKNNLLYTLETFK